MKIYESTTLADYVSANWMTMDPDVLRLMERTVAYIQELEADVDDWKANYEDVHETCRQLYVDVSDVVFKCNEDPEQHAIAIGEELQGILEDVYLEPLR